MERKEWSLPYPSSGRRPPPRPGRPPPPPGRRPPLPHGRRRPSLDAPAAPGHGSPPAVPGRRPQPYTAATGAVASGYHAARLDAPQLRTVGRTCLGRPRVVPSSSRAGREAASPAADEPPPHGPAPATAGAPWPSDHHRWRPTAHHRRRSGPSTAEGLIAF
nr:uncharacterized protein LOC127347307 [Lolium perenne]